MNARKQIVFFVVSGLMLLGTAVQGFALTNTELETLRKDSAFRTAEGYLNQALADAQQRLLPQDFEKIEKIQKQWLGERDTEAKAMISDGMEQLEAWTVLYDSQAEFLAGKIELYALNRTGNATEGAYEYSRQKDGRSAAGIMSIQAGEAPNSYDVSIEVMSGTPDSPNLCSYVGAGVLEGNKLEVSAEDSDATLLVVFDGKKATVTASKSANAQCGAETSLDGVYMK